MSAGFKKLMAHADLVAAVAVVLVVVMMIIPLPPGLIDRVSSVPLFWLVRLPPTMMAPSVSLWVWKSPAMTALNEVRISCAFSVVARAGALMPMTVMPSMPKKTVRKKRIAE